MKTFREFLLESKFAFINEAYKSDFIKSLLTPLMRDIKYMHTTLNTALGSIEDKHLQFMTSSKELKNVIGGATIKSEDVVVFANSGKYSCIWYSRDGKTYVKENFTYTPAEKIFKGTLLQSVDAFIKDGGKVAVLDKKNTKTNLKTIQAEREYSRKDAIALLTEPENKERSIKMLKDKLAKLYKNEPLRIFNNIAQILENLKTNDPYKAAVIYNQLTEQVSNPIVKIFNLWEDYLVALWQEEASGDDMDYHWASKPTERKFGVFFKYCESIKTEFDDADSNSKNFEKMFNDDVHKNMFAQLVELNEDVIDIYIQICKKIKSDVLVGTSGSIDAVLHKLPYINFHDDAEKIQKQINLHKKIVSSISI